MLNTLLVPLFLATSIFIGVGTLERRSVVLQDMSVPVSIRNAGYPPSVVSARISDAISAIEGQARTRPEARRLALQADKGPVELIGDYFHLTPIVQALQDVTGMLDWSVSGEIVELGDRLQFRARVRQHDGTTRTLSVEKPRGDIEALLAEAAQSILLVIDPHVVCSALLARAVAAGDGNYDRARECMYGAMANAQRSDLVWLINMQGVIRYLQNDPPGAMHAFARAIRLDNDFSPALLNLGILYAEAGRHEEAIRAFRQSFARVSVGDSPQTYAATLVEWGDSLLALGRRTEALAKYEEATRLDPRYARAFFRWAEVLGPGPRADQLVTLGRVSQGGAEPLYVENLVGVVRTTRDAARLER